MKWVQKQVRIAQYEVKYYLLAANATAYCLKLTNVNATLASSLANPHNQCWLVQRYVITIQDFHQKWNRHLFQKRKSFYNVDPRSATNSIFNVSQKMFNMMMMMMTAKMIGSNVQLVAFSERTSSTSR